ncbi:MAG: hypothetical protein AB2A00_27970 [Myxococcota bacterium]
MTRPRYCPWVTRPTHEKNGRLQVDKWRPIAYGYCPQTPDCASCAGTLYKPNILMHIGRETDTVACPYCAPERYRKEVEKLKAANPRLFVEEPKKEEPQKQAPKAAPRKPPVRGH